MFRTLGLLLVIAGSCFAVPGLPDLTITKTHDVDFPAGGTGTYILTVTNSGTGDKAAGQAVSVTDTATGHLTVIAMSGPGWTCTTLPVCTRNDVLLAGNSYPAITVTVSVAINAFPAIQTNSASVTTDATESDTTNNSVTDPTLIVYSDETITKTHTGNFTQGGTGTYSVTVTNIGTGEKVAGQPVTVTDMPPSGLTVTAMSGPGWTCTTLPVCSRSDSLAVGASYPVITVTVSVAANATSPQVNSVEVLTPVSEVNTKNNDASDSTIIETDTLVKASFQIRYASNLTAGDSLIDITNTGANGAPLFGPGVGDPVGNICVNVYAFSPDEQLVSCCSCLVTPNGLVHLSANNDLVSNTLTGIRPNSIVVKLLATGAGAAFNGSSCTNSAALAGTNAFPLANGMLAWGTTLHSASSVDPNPPGPFSITETPFLPASLDKSELNSIVNRCTNIIGNGSTFGQCRSCRLGGLGASKL